jgi:proton glutamate symport protein
MKSRSLVVAALCLFLALLLSSAGHRGLLPSLPSGAALLRWMGLLAFAVYSFRRRSLTVWILFGTLAGAEFGHDWPSAALSLQILGAIFLRLIKVIIAPLLFGTLVVGIAGHADLKKVGRMGVKALVYFEIVSTLALLIGFGAIHITRAGIGVRLPQRDVLKEVPKLPSHIETSELVANIFPENIAKSVAEGQVLQVVVFSILFGMALALVPEAKRRPLVELALSLSETMFRFTNLVMVLAPVGVFGAIAYTVGHMGIGILLPLLKLLATMYVALAVFVVVVLLPIAVFVRLPLLRFLKAVMEPVTIAFATASSEAALPRAMEQMERFGIDRETVAFVLPTGYSFNLDGSSLYQSLALIFVTQVAGIHLSFGQDAMMLLTLLVSSKGTAGVARASLVVVLAVASSFHLPSEPIFLLFGIDQLMDMARSSVNVLGNCLATVVISRWEQTSA